MTQQIKASSLAYVPEYSIEDYKHHFQAGSYEEAMRYVILLPEPANRPEGWILVGRAQITLDTPSLEDLVARQITVLREQRSAVQAKAQSTINQIDEKIQNLLAIGHTPKQSEADYGELF